VGQFETIDLGARMSKAIGYDMPLKINRFVLFAVDRNGGAKPLLNTAPAERLRQG